MKTRTSILVLCTWKNHESCFPMRSPLGDVNQVTTSSWGFHRAKAPSFFPRSILVEAKTIPQGPLVTSSTGKRKVPILVFECGCSFLHPPLKNECQTSNESSSNIMAQDPHLPPPLESWWKSWGVGVSTEGRMDADASPDSNTADLSSIPERSPTSPTGHHFIFSKSQFVPYLGKPRIPIEITEVLSLSVALRHLWAIFSNFGFCFCFTNVGLKLKDSIMYDETEIFCWW